MTNDAPECAECGEDMVKRRNKQTDEEFWGCPLYPQCDGTRESCSEPQHPGYPDWARDPSA